MPTWAEADCPYCHGVGFVRYEVPLGHEKFGKIELCVCRSVDRAETARNRLVITVGLATITHNPECTAIIIAAGEAKAQQRLACSRHCLGSPGM